MLEKKSALILSNSHLKSDVRIRRQISALKQNFDLTTAALSPSGEEIAFESIYEAPSFSLARKLKRFFQLITGRYDLFYRDDGKRMLAEKLSKRNFDLIVANDIQTLPLALALAAGSGKVYFDAHEYHPREWEDDWKWRMLYRKYVAYLCRKYIPKADAFSTVCESIAVEYEKFTGVKPLVVTNATNYEDLVPSIVSAEKIRIIHHGASIPSRKIENMIEVMKHLDERYSLDLMLTDLDRNYLSSLKKKSEANPRINFVPAVRPDEICRAINNYDIGMYILQPSNFNNLYALPNKIFDFVQARLCIAVSPNPEMADMIRKYGLGVIAGDFSPAAMAEVIRNLTREKIMHHKNQSHLNARILSSETNIRKLRDIAEKLTAEKLPSEKYD
jgi:glycosyltransferase involved in cell wall biosynthesis